MNNFQDKRIFVNGTSLEAVATIQRFLNRGVLPGQIIYAMEKKLDDLFNVGQKDLMFHKERLLKLSW